MAITDSATHGSIPGLASKQAAAKNPDEKGPVPWSIMEMHSSLFCSSRVSSSWVAERLADRAE